MENSASDDVRPEGARNADAVRFEGWEPILAVPGGPFRAGSGGWRFPRVNPGLGYAFLATSGRKTLNRYRHEVPGMMDDEENSPVPAGRLNRSWLRNPSLPQNRVEHHRRRTFQQEYPAFLKRQHSTHSTRCRLLKPGLSYLGPSGPRL